MSNGAAKKPDKPAPAEKEIPRARPIWGPRPLEAVAGGFLFAAGAFLFDKLVSNVFGSSDDEE